MRLEARTYSDGADGTVSAVIAYPERFDIGATPAVVLAHGAGTDMANPFLSTVHEGLAARGFVTVKFNFPYKERGGRAPDRAPVLEACYRAVLAAVRTELRPPTLVIGGKSLGGRMASHLAAQGEAVDGLVLLGYPLHPPRRPDRPRVRHLSQITVPMLFLAGSRDPLSDLDLLKRAIGDLESPVTLHVIQDGDHSFEVLKRTGRTRNDVVTEIIDRTEKWLKTTIGA